MRKDISIKSKEGKERLDYLMQLDAAELEELLATDLTEDEKIDVVAIRILKERMGAFMELAK